MEHVESQVEWSRYVIILRMVTESESRQRHWNQSDGFTGHGCSVPIGQDGPVHVLGGQPAAADGAPTRDVVEDDVDAGFSRRRALKRRPHQLQKLKAKVHAHVGCPGALCSQTEPDS